MKVRIKFSKHGPTKYIGHLDMMRYFQKCMRRAEIDIKYSGGYSPHQIMSFAHPLGVGMETDGDYFDIEMNSFSDKEDIMSRLNAVMATGVRILDISLLDDKAPNAMASVAAALYKVTFENGDSFLPDILARVEQFFGQDEILYTKETKKNTLEVDLKPHIYKYSFSDKEFECLVDASSAGNIKSTQILEALYAYCNVAFDKNDFLVNRVETFADAGNDELHNFVPLSNWGKIND